MVLLLWLIVPLIVGSGPTGLFWPAPLFAAGQFASGVSLVEVYPIALGHTRPEIFVQLATVTGGRSFLVSDVRQLQTTLSSVVRELRLQYLLGYMPTRGASERPTWRGIRVRVNRPELRVRARDGYDASR